MSAENPEDHVLAGQAAVQGDNLELSIALERSEANSSSVVDDFLVMSSLRAPEFANDERAPVDLCVVIDRSGSMSGPRLRLAKETCNFVVDQLDGNDRLAIVAYDNEVDTFMELAAMDDAGKEKARAALKSVTARGSTNLCGGLIRGIDLMRVAEVIKDVRSVLLFTDGEANCGYTTSQDIVRAMTDPDYAAKGDNHRGGGFGGPPLMYGGPPPPMPPPQQQQQQKSGSFFGSIRNMFGSNSAPAPPPPQQQQQQAPPPQQQQQQAPPQPPSIGSAPVQTPNGPPSPPSPEPQPEPQPVIRKRVPLGVSVNAFGYGEGHDANLLQAIAEEGHGMYYFVESGDKIADAFADCLGGLLSVVARNIRIRFEALNGVRIKRVLSKYACEEREQGVQFELTLPDLQSEEARDVIIETTLPALDQPTDEWDAVKVTLTYHNLITDSQVSESQTIRVRRSETETADAPKNLKIDEQYNRWLAAEAMEKANEQAARGEMEQARKAVEQAQARIEKSPSARHDYSSNLVGDLKKCSAGLKSRREYEAQGSKYMNVQMQCHQMQRSSNINDDAQTSYGYHSRAKKAMQSRFKTK